MIVRGLRLANFDCLVGINLLREGLDLPEVALVAVLDADKEGFLRSGTSLIQVAGRTARHINGKVILYADTVTDSMRRMIDVTERRRRIQKEYNERHHITPRSIAKSIGEGLAIKRESEEIEKSVVREAGVDYDIFKTIQEVEREMLEAAEALEFERAAVLRDELRELQRMTESGQDGTLPPEKKAGRSRKK
jgi:excinuclease ABC subunit B